MRHLYNTVRLSAAVGYVTPDDEHEGRGPAIRQARRDGLTQAREMRIEYRRNLQVHEIALILASIKKPKVLN